MPRNAKPCKWCGQLTTSTALLECNSCWEIRTRFEANPAVTLSIIRTQDPVFDLAVAIAKTILEPGTNPRYHRFIRTRHMREWPALWQHLKKLVRELNMVLD